MTTKTQFRKGDRVVTPNGTFDGMVPAGSTGTVLEDSPIPHVRWDNDVNGHDADGLCEYGHGWAVDTRDIQPVQAEAGPVVFTVGDRALDEGGRQCVVVRDDGGSDDTAPLLVAHEYPTSTAHIWHHYDGRSNIDRLDPTLKLVPGSRVAPGSIVCECEDGPVMAYRRALRLRWERFKNAVLRRVAAILNPLG